MIAYVAGRRVDGGVTGSTVSLQVRGTAHCCCSSACACVPRISGETKVTTCPVAQRSISKPSGWHHEMRVATGRTLSGRERPEALRAYDCGLRIVRLLFSSAVACTAETQVAPFTYRHCYRCSLGDGEIRSSSSRTTDGKRPCAARHPGGNPGCVLCPCRRYWRTGSGGEGCPSLIAVLLRCQGTVISASHGHRDCQRQQDAARRAQDCEGRGSVDVERGRSLLCGAHPNTTWPYATLARRPLTLITARVRLPTF